MAKLEMRLMTLPVGSIIDFVGNNIPNGYLECNGAAVSRTTYKALFDAIGTAWGAGNGSTTFNLPDMGGRTTIGTGRGHALASVGAQLGGVQEDGRVHELHGQSVRGLPLRVPAQRGGIEVSRAVCYRQSERLVGGPLGDPDEQLVRHADERGQRQQRHRHRGLRRHGLVLLHGGVQLGLCDNHHLACEVV